MYIESELYSKIIENIPIICVDGLIVENNKILLLKRLNEPAIGEWWFPGGRVLKNEKIEDSIIRKVKEETNLETIILKQIGITETIFDKKHTINICFLLKLNSNEIILNSEHDEYNWFSMDQLPKLDYRILNIINIIRDKN